MLASISSAYALQRGEEFEYETNMKARTTASAHAAKKSKGMRNTPFSNALYLSIDGVLLLVPIAAAKSRGAGSSWARTDGNVKESFGSKMSIFEQGAAPARRGPSQSVSFR